MREFLVEALYHIWVRYERFVAWRMKRAKGGDVIIRESWIHRREAAQDSLGTPLDYKPQSKISRFFDLLLWYSPLGQYMVWRIKKSDW